MNARASVGGDIIRILYMVKSPCVQCKFALESRYGVLEICPIDGCR